MSTLDLLERRVAQELSALDAVMAATKAKNEFDQLLVLVAPDLADTTRESNRWLEALDIQETQ